MDVEDEDHFWRGRDGLERLEGEVGKWVEERAETEDASL